MRSEASVFIIDDDAAVRDSLVVLLRGEGIRARGFASGLDFFEHLPEDPTACVITDVRMPGLDGVEAQHPATWGAKLYEQVKYVTKTGHINLITGLVTSKAWYDKLPADVQKVLREEALRAGDEASRGTIASLANYEKMMKDKGLTVADIDTTPFRQATQGVYEKLGYADLRKQVEGVLR